MRGSFKTVRQFTIVSLVGFKSDRGQTILLAISVA